MVTSDQQRYREERGLDQEWEELLDELRVVLPGTGVLFAFLLSLPFTTRFAEVTNADKTVYYSAFLAAAVATLLLTAPGAQHRLLWRQHQKNDQLIVATRLAIAGTLFLAIAIASVVFLITDFLYNSALPAVITVGIIGMIAWLWYIQPLFMRLRDRSANHPSDGLSGEAQQSTR